MKHLKQILTITVLSLFIVSCNSPERSIGMTNWTDDGTEFKFYLGTEEAIDVVRSWDKLQSEGKWKESLELFADTATVTYQTGQTVKASEMTEMARKRDSNLLKSYFLKKLPFGSSFLIALIAVGAVKSDLTLCSEIIFQNTPASGVPTGFPSNKIVVHP